jgi:hypothetical protein
MILVVLKDKGVSPKHTLLAGFDFSFSKIFCDSVLDALILKAFTQSLGERRAGYVLSCFTTNLEHVLGWFVLYRSQQIWPFQSGCCGFVWLGV